MKKYVLGDLSSFIFGRGQASVKFAYTKLVVVTLIRQICAAITTMHQEGITHCDIKPANVLLDIDNHARLSAALTDFGISRVVADTVDVAGFTAAKLNGASIGYAGPEVFLRLRKNTDVENAAIFKAGDIYAIGISSYEMLNRLGAWKGFIY